MMESAIEIPVVDFSAFSIDHKTRPNTDSDEVQALAKNLFHAFSTIGFVYLKNHGIPHAQMEQVFQAMDAFFLLDEEVKSKYKLEDALVHNGWIGVGSERAKKTIEDVDREKPKDLREHFGLADGYLDEVNWPDDEVPCFKPTIQSVFSKLQSLSERVLSLIAIGLDSSADAFVEPYKQIGTKQGGSVMRLNYYPAISDDIHPLPSQQRIAEHTDFGDITLLVQDDAGGYEVKVADGKYVLAPPIEGTVMVNIGELMHRWSSDRLKANYHRILMPPQGSRHRRSFAMYAEPDKDAVVTCLDGSDKYPPIKGWDYISYRIKAMAY